MFKLCYLCLLFLGLLTYPALAISNSIHSDANPTNIIHSVGADDGYNAQLLKLALSHSKNHNYQITAFPKDIPKGRRLSLLNTSNKLHVEVGTATRERETKYLAIPFPILKGLNGWRIPLVNSKHSDKFKHIDTISQFKKLRPVQFHTWSDSQILKSNGIDVIKGGNVEGLYNMLHRERVDYFPRSTIEIDINLKEHNTLNITKDKHVLIHYPTAFFFYVGKHNTELATNIMFGLEQALKDGSFDRLINKFYGQNILEIQQTNRKVFTLHNPFLPEAFPLERSELWISPFYP